jgi:septal ring factor EnvC (AmiA/AmiB activator)
MKEKSNGSRLTIKEYKMNGVFIKPELLVPDKRKQLASKLKETYTQEKLAYEEKKRTENAREEAAQQSKLVAAKITKQAASDYKEAERLKGEGNKLRMIEEAIGQRELAEVLGVDKTYGLEMAKTLKDYPDAAWNTPFFYGGSGNGSAQDNAYTGITIKQMISSMSDLGIESTTVDDYVKEYNKKSKKAKQSKEENKKTKTESNKTNKTDAQKTLDDLNSK